MTFLRSYHDIALVQDLNSVTRRQRNVSAIQFQVIAIKLDVGILADTTHLDNHCLTRVVFDGHGLLKGSRFLKEHKD